MYLSKAEDTSSSFLPAIVSCHNTGVSFPFLPSSLNVSLNTMSLDVKIYALNWSIQGNMITF